jgi:hypothetical protein
MNEKRNINALRRKYRNEWDAHQLLAHRNALFVRTGRQPSNEQLIDEQRAAEAVQRACNELKAALAEARRQTPP